MPLTDDGRAKALLYTSNLPATYERQCLAQSVGVFQFRPRGLQLSKEVEESFDGRRRVVAWIVGGDYLRGPLKIWMDGRPHPSPNAQHMEGGFATGKWEGSTLTARVTHVKTAWIRRGVGIPGSDQSTFTVHITRHDNLLTITTIQEDPVYLTEPHVVSRVWEYDPHGDRTERGICNTAGLIPYLEDSGIVPHYPPGQNPEEDYMAQTFNVPQEAAMGYAETLYPEYRKKIQGQLHATRGLLDARTWVLLCVDRAARPTRGSAEPHVQRRWLWRPRPRGRRSSVDNSSSRVRGHQYVSAGGWPVGR